MTQSLANDKIVCTIFLVGFRVGRGRQRLRSHSPQDKRQNAPLSPSELLYLCGHGIGVAGDQLFYIALAWYCIEVSGLESTAGLVAFLGALPRTLLLLPGGVVADRRGSKHVAVRAASVRTALLSLAVAGTFLQGMSLGLLVVAATMFGVTEAFYLPSSQSMVATVGKPGSEERLQPLFSGVEKVALSVGSAFGGVCIGVLQPSGAFLIMAAASAVSAAMLALVKEGRPAPAGTDVTVVSIFAGVTTGLRKVLTRPSLRSTLILMTVAEFAASGLTGVGYAMLSSEQGWGSERMGAILSYFGAGAAMASFLVALFGTRRGAELVGPSMSIVGLAFAASGACKSPLLCALLAGVAGLGSGVSSTMLLTRFVTQAEGGQLGVSMSLLSIAVFAAAPLSYLYCSLVAGLVSVVGVFCSLGALLVLTSLRCRYMGVQETDG